MGNSETLRTVLNVGLGTLLVLVLFLTGTEGACSADPVVNMKENNTVGAVVAAVAVTEGFSAQISTPQFPFSLVENNLVATQVLDFETMEEPYFYQVGLNCISPDGQPSPFQILVFVVNINDNPPHFAQSQFSESIGEMTKVNTTVGTFRATDADEMGSLYYSLTPTSDAFKLKSGTVPELLVAKSLQFDDVKSVRLTLTVQDTDPDTPTATPSHTATTVIDITITDVDNRPPWFQPCTVVDVQGVKICPSTGYSGTVNLGELETEPLPLKPSHIWAKDGDAGINEPIKYTIVSGAEGLFEIGADSGNITLLKAVDVTRTVHMTVMAYQAVNSHQFSTTSLTMEVVIQSAHKPQFEKPRYEAVVVGVGSMAVEAADSNQILKMVATDEDYAAVGGINPNIVYSVTDNTDFSIVGGFLFMTTQVPAGVYNMEVKAVDSSNSEEATAQVSVEVIQAPTTTAAPTTASATTPEPTTGKTPAPTTAPTPGTTAPTPGTTAPTPGTTAPSPAPTTKPEPTDPSTGLTSNPSSNPTGVSAQTSDPTPTPEGSTAHTGAVILPPGGFSSGDLAALGATLGVLLFVCVVVIAVLAVKVRKGNLDWRKINEASAFRSALGPSGQKDGVQFTNEAFQHDDDKTNKGGPSGGPAPPGSESDKPNPRSVPRPPSPIEDEKVRPILSKDKSKEDGYKAVWFKEDIDPNANEEVVIIPERGADEDDEDDEDDSEAETKSPGVKFNDADGDSGLGDKNEDSEEERVVTSSL